MTTVQFLKSSRKFIIAGMDIGRGYSLPLSTHIQQSHWESILDVEEELHTAPYPHICSQEMRIFSTESLYILPREMRSSPCAQELLTFKLYVIVHVLHLLKAFSLILHTAISLSSFFATPRLLFDLTSLASSVIRCLCFGSHN